MEINNFEVIKQFIENFGDIQIKNHRDKYFEVQIIRRGKDHPNLPAANRYYMSFNIHNSNDLMKYKDEIIAICKALKARAYIRISPLIKSKVMIKTLENIAKCISNGDIDTNAHRCFLSAQGLTKPLQKFWILDVDTKDNQIIDRIPQLLQNLDPRGDKIIAKWPTLHGWHIITHTFNTSNWSNVCAANNIEYIEIKKNQLGLLYYYDE